MSDKAETIEGFDGDMRRWSIPEVISFFNISRDEIVDLDNRASSSNMGACSIDVDALYNVTNGDNIQNEESFISFDSVKFTESQRLLSIGEELNP